jgi:hypothetical protein
MTYIGTVTHDEKHTFGIGEAMTNLVGEHGTREEVKRRQHGMA